MFSVHCPRHRAEVLLSSRQIEALHNTDAGIEVHWRCRCGFRGVARTGRQAVAGSGLVARTTADRWPVTAA